MTPPIRPIRPIIPPAIQALIDYQNRLRDVQAINARSRAPELWPAGHQPSGPPVGITVRPDPTAIPVFTGPQSNAPLPFQMEAAQADVTQNPVTQAAQLAAVPRPDHGMSGMELLDDWLHGLTGIDFGRAPRGLDGQPGGGWGRVGMQALGMAGLFAPEALGALRGVPSRAASAESWASRLVDNAIYPGEWSITSSPARSHFGAPVVGNLNLEVPTFMREPFRHTPAPVIPTMETPTFLRREAGFLTPMREGERVAAIPGSGGRGLEVFGTRETPPAPSTPSFWEQVHGPSMRSGLLGNERGAVPIWTNEPSERLFSRTQRAIEAAPFDKGTAQQWLAHLERAPGGTFREEVDRAGLREWLNQSATPQLDLLHGPNAPITKEEMLTRLRENPLQVSERRYTGGNTRYGEYKLRGGQNYREVILSSRGPGTEAQNEARIAMSDLEESLRSALPNEGMLVDNIMHPTRSTRHEAIRFIEQHHPELLPEAQSLERSFIASTQNQPYTSSHWPGVEDPVVHVRMTDREIGGKPTTFLEEVQSDVHQAGRESGYINPETGEGSVPKLPFSRTEDWSGLAIRRALDDAVASGSEQLAWTTGTQQADRYNLARYVDQVAYDPVEGKLTAHRNGNPIVDQAVPREELSTYLGKELADRLLAEPMTGTNHVLRGERLSVGGGGMKNYYDTMLPKMVKEQFRKLGVKVEPRLEDMAHAQGHGMLMDTDLRELSRQHSNDILSDLYDNVERGPIDPDDLPGLLDEAEERVRDYEANRLAENWEPPKFDRDEVFNDAENSVDETWTGDFASKVFTDRATDPLHIDGRGWTLETLNDLDLKYEAADFRDSVVRTLERNYDMTVDDAIPDHVMRDAYEDTRKDYIESELDSFEEMWQDEHKNDEPPYEEFSDEASEFASRQRREAESLLDEHEGTGEPGKVWVVDIPPELRARVQSKGLPLGHAAGAAILPATAAVAGGALTAGLLATQQPSETTKLPSQQEQQFQAWAKANGITDVDHPDSRYDYRGFWKETNGAPHAAGTHFPDTFKQHGHPTFSVESRYSRGPNDGGHWEGERFIPPKKKKRS